MDKKSIKALFPEIEPSSIGFLPVLDQFHEGVIVTDARGNILYMNPLQEKIDDLNFSDVEGKNIREVYQVDDDLSPAARCIRTGKKVDSLACFYRTRTGKVVNSIHNVIPLYATNKLIGTLCFIRAYSVLEKELESFSGQDQFSDLQAGTRPAPETKRLKNGTRFTFSDIIGESPGFKRAMEATRMASDSPSPVMLYGKTGTGKELLAQSIHNRSRRHKKQFVALNCAAIPENLLEGILFGTTKGAFTGATDKAGLFEKASGGTLFLDEINSMALGLQAKLLRVLQEHKVRRVGSLSEIPLDLKIISSVNESPHRAIRNRTFRSDLLYRLGVVFIRIPTLKERREDMESLIRHFILKYNRQFNKRVSSLSPEAMSLFHAYDWPGNVRELQHVIEGAMNLVKDRSVIGIKHLSVHIGGILAGKEHSGQEIADAGRAGEPAGLSDHQSAGASLHPSPGLAGSRQEYEIRVITETLTLTRGNVAKAARHLKLSPQLLHYKLKKYGVEAEAFKPMLQTP